MKTILLHGALDSAEQMKPLSDLIESETVCLDFAGHGKLVFNQEPFSIRNLAEQVLSQLTGPTELFGYSMGGYVGLYLASKHPEMITRVTTLATKFNWTPEGAKQEVRMLNPKKVREKVPAFAKLLESRHSVYWSEVMNRTAEMMLELGRSPVITSSLLKAVKCPVVLMRGSNDNMVTQEETLWAKNLISDSKYLELKDQPHPLEKVDLELVISALK